MTDRTFRQHALGFGGNTASVLVQIDNAVIFNGAITTVDQPVPLLPNEEYMLDNIAWTWQADANAQGVFSYVITVNSGTLLLADTQCNNPLADPTLYGRPDPVNIGEEIYLYPYISAAYRNDQQLPLNPAPWRQGQYWFPITQGDVLVLNLNLIPSSPPPPISLEP